MINPANNIMPFLAALQQNNNKPWFDQNRDWFKAAQADFSQLITDVIEILSDTEPKFAGLTAKDCIYRIYRDLRFSFDKTPYKTHFSANIAPGGKNSEWCGFYVQLEPNNLSMCGGGLWIEDKNILKAVRNELYSVPEDLVEIIETKEFKRYFGGLWDYQKLKKVPTGFDADFKYADLLKYKHYIVTNTLTDEQVASPDLYSHIASVHRTLHPMCRLLDSIIEDAGLL
ncbi:MAG: DUF2461 domain-containing protein [Salinivirgaceae bacterium]|nr:DUF2461 domain-containing protein [Salinivirgaceae bacterium]